MRVRKAVFPAAGWGTRFLPATKASPKEMLPLVDKPVIQYAVEEAVAAGIEQVIIVTSSQKRAIEDHFDSSFELESLLEARGEIETLRKVRHISDLAQVSYVRQKEQLGLGHAVLMARELVGHEPFAVILSDDVVVAQRPCIGQLIHAYGQTHASCVAVMQVPHEDTSRYGVIDPDPDASDHGDPRLHKLRGLVEKPTPAAAPSDLAIIGRYVLTPKIFEKLEQTPRGAGGEIQLTDAIQALMQEQSVYGYAFEGVRYDAGTTMGWLKASVELALERPEIGPEFRRYLAVKLLRPEYGRDAGFVARFRQEAQAAASLAHPNVVAVFDYGTEEAGPYIVMELVEGQDLGRILRDRGALPAAASARIAMQVADGLAAAHAQGIVHRDIKPSNVLITVSGQVKVADFGIARALSEAQLTLHGQTLGSARYLSPEQARGENVTPAADIYSLGLVLFEMLTGRAAWGGDTAAAVAMVRLTEEPPVQADRSEEHTSE